MVFYQIQIAIYIAGKPTTEVGTSRTTKFTELKKGRKLTGWKFSSFTFSFACRSYHILARTLSSFVGYLKAMIMS